MHSGSTNEIDKISVRSLLVGSTALRHRELERDVQEAIQSAGLVPAHVIGIDQVGTVEAGKRADLIVIAGDPLDDIRNTRNLGSSSRTEPCIALPNCGRAWDISLESEAPVGRTSYLDSGFVRGMRMNDGH
jgi:hypothetical protein